MKVVAFVPARSGSNRIRHKNIRQLNGHPLLAYSIQAALKSRIFDSVICATDSEEYARIALDYGAEVPFLRPVAISEANSPDIDWVEFMLDGLGRQGRLFDAFAILRPTSPFRTHATIQRAYERFLTNPAVHSIRAVEEVDSHPGKMWVDTGDTIQPLLPFKINDVPWHSNQKSALPKVLIQNASLEMAWTSVVNTHKSISGSIIAPFYTQGSEGFDINTEDDWIIAEHYLAKGLAVLPNIN